MAAVDAHSRATIDDEVAFDEVAFVDGKRLLGLGFGALLRHHRLAAGLSQEALAERARMSAVGIGALERGARQHPYHETVVLLATALNFSPAATAELEAVARRPRLPRSGIDPVTASASGRRSRALPRGDGSTSTAALTTEDGRPQVNTNLPFALTSLIGRNVELGEISRLVHEHRLVTLTGAGGVGKTRCALEIATRALNDLVDGAWLIELAPLRDPALVRAFGGAGDHRGAAITDATRGRVASPACQTRNQ